MPADEPRAATTTILFTDLVNSTELLQRAGDEQAQRIFGAHHRLLRDAVAANGGQEVKWLGDGLMVAFGSAADAVRCAIAVQQASQRASAERLDVRVGLNVGDALRDETDYFGTPVVVAKRLCDHAQGGQILCSSLVAGLLAGRHAFAFNDLGSLALKGIEAPVATSEVVYERDEANAIVARTPFVGRVAESTKLRQKLDEARTGRGGLAMLVGEPGIGKTRTAQEFADAARDGGATVLWGRCFEGEWAPPYGPFAEAIEEYARHADADELRADLGHGAPPIARLASAVRDRLPDVPDPAPLQPDEERFRLLDAVSQFLIALAARAPVVLVLDDVHWADRGTIAMLRHVARFAPKHRLLVIGAYRDVELDRQHPLADALGALRREAEYDRVVLKGLSQEEVGSLLSTLAEQDVNPALVQAISDETDGNPFFIREVLAHLVEEGKLYREEGRWTSRATSIAELGIPEGVRQVITRRLSRLSDGANRLLSAASGFNGGFRFQTVAAVAGIDEDAALDAIDEALASQLLRPGSDAEHYDFMHALIRHTLYGELNPSRQVRLHRRIAEVMEERVKTYTPERQAAHGAELAYQYHRSAAIPGAEQGVEHALLAVGRAEGAYAYDEAAQFLRIALDLLPEGDSRRPRLLARYAVALAWTLRFDESVAAAIEAGAAIATSEGEAAAADFLADAADELFSAGSLRGAWSLAGAGLPYAREHDATWSRLVYLDVQRREAANPESAGSNMPLDTPEYDEFVNVIGNLQPGERPTFFNHSREQVLREAEANTTLLDGAGAAFEAADHRGDFNIAFPLGWQAGEFRRARKLFAQSAAENEASGRIAMSAGSYGMLARCHNALGDLDAAKVAYDRSLELAGRLAGDPLLGAQSIPAQQVVAALDELRLAREAVAEESVVLVRGLLAGSQPEFQWARSTIEAGGARIFAEAGNVDEALAVLDALARRIDRIPGWDPNNVRILSDAAHALWALQRTDHLDVIERNLREKVIAPDFRYPMFDGRRAMALLCALSGRFDEARDWFAKARTVLEEQGARPLRAIVDYDEGLMYVRRNGDGDAALARPLLEAALGQFREIGMTGWVRRAEDLLDQTKN
ncbi:MAG: AAA family ATPase [Dehalococcoidia bacterium]